MAKRKTTPFKPWETAAQGGIEKRYIRCGNSQMLHPAMRSLSANAFRIYLYMRLEAGGEREFVYTRSKYKDLCSNEAFQRAKNELIEKGFITVKENNAHRQKANIYEFSDKWKDSSRPP
jgi:hypothetical protein